MTSDAPAAFVGVSGGVVALSGLCRLPGLVFSSLVALGFPWVLGAVWSPLGFKFLVEVSFGGAQSSALPSIFVFTLRFAFLVLRRMVLVPGFLHSCP